MMDNTSSGLGFSSENVLSSERLFSRRKPGDKSLPKAGWKDFAPDGSWLDTRRLDQFHQEWRTVLSEQRVEKLGNLVVGNWNPEIGLIEFKKEQGKFWAHMGFVDHQRKWLYPEEALYLMETTILEVKYGGVPLSIQQAYSTFLGSSVSLEEYQIYAHMRRLGFVVIRHHGSSGTTNYERKIRIDQHLPDGRRKRKHKLDKANENTTGEKIKETEASNTTSENQSDSTGDKRDDTKCEDTSVTLKQSNIKKMKLVNTEMRESTVSPDSENVCSNPDMVTVTDIKKDSNVPVKELTVFDMEVDMVPRLTPEIDFFRTFEPCVTNASYIQTKYVDFSLIDAPSVAGKEKITLQAPAPGFLPETVILPSDSLEIDISSLHLNSSTNKRRKGDWSKKFAVSHPPDLRPFDFSFPQYFPGSPWNIKARNWGEYKAEKKRIEIELSSLEESPVSRLWSGDVTPLVKPQDANCTANLLDKLQVVQEFGMQSSASSNPVDDEIKIVYDIYQPGKSFKKSRPGIPHCRVTIQQSCSHPPSMGEVTRLTKLSDDDVPVIWAVVSCGEMTFYTFGDVSLPIDINMG